MSEPQLTVAPTFSPITLADARQACRLTSQDEDDELRGWIDEAVARLQDETWRQFCTATYTLTFDSFANKLILPRPPLASVSSITYLDVAGVSQTLATSVYEVVTNQTPGLVRLKYAQSWPNVRGHADVITVTFLAGWTAAATPTWVKQSVKYLVAHLYEFRSADPLPKGIANLLDRAGFPV